MSMRFGRWLAGVVAVAAVGTGAFAADILKSDDLVAVCGDSITEQKDYSADIEAYLLMCRAAGPVRVAQFGWGGDSMGWFWGRGGPKDIMVLHPTVVTTCYGMNDGGYRAVTEKTLNDYRDGMRRLIAAFKADGVRVVVGSPGAVDSTTFRSTEKEADTYNETLGALGEVAAELAKENGMPFANVHDVMMDVMVKAKAKYGPDYQVAGSDGVHPGANGHLVMAYAFLKAMGCDGEIGTITVDTASGRAQASEGHKILSAGNGKVEVESSRYPFCFWGDPASPNATTGIIEFFPFNEDLNRFTLVVTGAPAGQYKVTWGDSSKTYSAEELAKGVNLAADFMQNPFSSQFAKVRQAIRRKEEFETALYKTFLPGADLMREAVKEANPQSDAFNQVEDAMLKRDGKLAADLRTQVTPVTHTIQIGAVK